MRAYPDGTLAVFHGPRRVAHYTAQGAQIVAVPTTSSGTPCAPPSRRGLATNELAAPAQRRPALTASAPGVTEPRQVGTKKRRSDRTRIRQLSNQGGDTAFALPPVVRASRAGLCNDFGLSALRAHGGGCWVKRFTMANAQWRSPNNSFPTVDKGRRRGGG